MLLRWSLFLYVIAHSVCSSSAIKSTVHVKEQVNEGHVISDVSRLISDSSTVTRRFKIIRQKLLFSSDTEKISRRKHVTEKHVDWLRIQEKTGVISVSRSFDRDARCSGVPECVIRAEVVVLPQEVFQLVELDVVVDDENDNAPVFPTDLVKLELPENKPVDEVISLDAYLAEDADTGNNSQIQYTLSQNDYFGLKQYVGENDTPHLQLFLMRYLDHEVAPEVDLVIMARDAGSQPQTSRMRLKIVITDENDNYPVFEKESYSVLLKENTAPGTVIATVSATDADEGIFGRIRYSIPARNNNLARKLISIGERTGEVTLKVPIDRETHDGLEVMIEARDSAPNNEKMGITWLYISVEDVNDNSPSIRVDFILMSEKNKVFALESTSIGTYIGRVSAVDEDDGDNGKVDIKLTTITPSCGRSKLKAHTWNIGKAVEQFSITEQGFLETRHPFDREACDDYDIIIKACDHGDPPRCSTKTVRVIILDVNEYTPLFNAPTQRVSLSEDAKVGVLVTTVTAIDGDSVNGAGLTKNNEGESVRSDNGKVFFSISNGSKGNFEIDRLSGKIRLSSPLDREKVLEWKLTVNARDGGFPPRKSSCEVIVHVDDVNDNSPRFTNPVINNSMVHANVLRNELITTIQAEDADDRLNGKLKYYLLSDDTYNSSETTIQISKTLEKIVSIVNATNTKFPYFILNPVTGDLRINFSQINVADGIGIHRLAIKAQDFGSPPRSTIIVLRVNVAKYANTRANIINTERNELSTASTDFLVLAISLGCATVLLMFLIIAVSIKCRRMNKEIRSLNKTTTNSTARPEVVCETDKLPQVEEGAVTGNSLEEDLHSNTAEKKSRSGSVCEKSEDAPPSNPAPQYQLSPSPVQLREPPLVMQRLEIAGSSHSDGDSGRGDSDIDGGSCNITDSKEYHQIKAIGSNCSEKCRQYGHGDACWLPNHAGRHAGETPEERARKRCALTYYDWNRLKPRHYQHPEERIQGRNRLSCALPKTSSSNRHVARSPNSVSSDGTPVPSPIERPHSNPCAVSEEIYAAGVSWVARQNKSYYQPLVSRSCQNTPCEFDSSQLNAALPRLSGAPKSVPCGNLTCGNLDTVYEVDYAAKAAAKYGHGSYIPPAWNVRGYDVTQHVNSRQPIRFVPCESSKIAFSENSISADAGQRQSDNALYLGSGYPSRERISMQETRQIIKDIDSLLV